MNRPDIVVSRWIALKGTLDLYRDNEEKLCKSIPSFILRRVAKFGELMAGPGEAGLFSDRIFLAGEMGKGGIYGALWELGERSGTGLFADLKEIPIKQETIEIANILDLDPYMLDSKGAFLFLAESGFELVRLFKEKGINAAVIGRITDDNDRVIVNGERRRYLTPPSKKDSSLRSE